jgi:glycosyltransferase involved in cell wall biosynthesis
MNILTVSTLYPNTKDHKHGIFVRTRLMHLIKHHSDIKPIVIAPIPWFPFSSKLLGQFAKKGEIPLVRDDNGVKVYHPRYLVIPKLGMFLAPFTLARCINKMVKQLRTELEEQSEHISLIDGHYFFPDGVAIAKVAKKQKLPFFCTARGTDINIILNNPLARKMINKVFAQSERNFAVSKALKDKMVSVGADPKDVEVSRNGVDLNLFSWSSNDERETLKKELGISGRLIVSVGGLVELKGHHLTIEALSKYDDVHLVIIGGGPLKSYLEALAEKHNVKDKVSLKGILTQPEINRWFMAADISVLASSREGWANVLLESMASGCPVVATKVGGTPEVVQSDTVGELCARSVDDLVQAINNVSSRTVDRKLVREYAEKFDWQHTSDLQYQFFSNLGNK